MKIRVIVNGQAIFPLLTTEPVVIALTDDHPGVVITDGFHITKTMELSFNEPSYYNFEVVCAINDLQLAGGALLVGLLYLMGFATGFFILKLLSFLPILVFIFIYYIRRKDFIKLVRA